MKKTIDVSYDKCYAECVLDAYFPRIQSHETIIYFHGGGLDSGKKDAPYLVEIAERFVSSGYGFVSVEYRKYPNAKFPSFIHDAAKSIAFVKNTYGDRFGLIVSGSSAGAWISLMLCLDEEYLRAENLSPLDIKGWLIDSAQTTSHFKVLMKEHGLHKLTQRIDESAPLFYVSENTRFSRIMLIYYENDMPCRPEQNLLLHRSILSFNPDADVEICKLPGKHCNGSVHKDDDGEYPYVKVALRWLSKNTL